MSATLRKSATLLAILSLSLVLGCSRGSSRFVSGIVIKIVDGDTITVLDAQNVQHKIRLQGIDAPEHRQNFSEVSKHNLAILVFQKHVTVVGEKTDRYGRLVGKVLLNGTDECLEQVKAGLAWHYKAYEREQSSEDRQLYAKAEQEARAQRLGLWKDAFQTPPWEYRRRSRESEVNPADDSQLLPYSGGRCNSGLIEVGS